MQFSQFRQEYYEQHPEDHDMAAWIAWCSRKADKEEQHDEQLSD